MDYAVVPTADVDPVDLNEVMDGLFDPTVRRIQADLGTEHMVVNLWEYDEGETMVHHAHDEQEEVYYVLDGRFECKFGDAGDTDAATVEAGTFFAVGPGVGHGHQCVSADGGRLLAVGSPNVHDINPETYTPYEDA